MAKNKKLAELLELANNYPSPHNGQPMRLVQNNSNKLDIEFQTERGLKSTRISYLFSFVTIGVFVRHLELCAQALGHKATVKLNLPKESKMGEKASLPCGSVTVKYDASKPDKELRSAIIKRQTSRKKYTGSLSSKEQDKLEQISKSYHLNLQFLDKKTAHQTIWLNQRAVFDDMFNEPVRKELDHWLRYDDNQKNTQNDGLSYDCMELSGSMLKFIMKNYKILRWPLVSQFLKQYYLRTMKDISTVGYITSPFKKEKESYQVGRCMIDMWLEMTKHGKYLHPFGTIVSNKQAHSDFAKLIGLHDESRELNYVVFIFRAGASPRPVESKRKPVKEHLYIERSVK